MKKCPVLLILIAALIFCQIPVTEAEASGSWTISHEKRTIYKGSSKAVVIKGATAEELKNAKWTVKKGKDVVSIRTNKRRSRALFIGKTPGTAKVSVKIGGREKICTVKVKNTSGYGVEATEASLKMLKSLHKNKQNTLISPDSILSCLAMTANGAEGKTLTEMEELFGTKSMSDYSAFWNEEHDRLTAANDDKNSKTSYSVANSIWTDNGQVKLSKDFINKNKEQFGADLYNLKFDDTALEKMNSWVDENTKGLIKKIIEELESDDVMVLLNAIAFEGQWADQYKDNDVDKNGTFTTKDGKKQTVNMLNGTEDGRQYLTLNGGNGFIKYYRGGDLAFFAYLPPEGKTVDQYLEGISGADFIDAYNNREEAKVITKMPEFSYDYETSLVEVLKEQGMKTAFTNNADFSGMLDLKADPTQAVKISDVIHKTHIEVDKNGTKAAAATAVIVAKVTARPQEKTPVYVTLDRPFVYGILDTQTGMPVFIGTLDSVK